MCHTGAIQLEITGDKVEIKPFNTIVKLRQCVSCGKGIASEALLGEVGSKLGDLSKPALLCNDCKKQKQSLALANSARYSKNV